MDNDRYDPVNCSLNLGISLMNVTFKPPGAEDALTVKKVALNLTRSHNFTWPEKCLDKLTMMVNLPGTGPKTRFCGHFNGGVSLPCAILDLVGMDSPDCRKGSE